MPTFLTIDGPYFKDEHNRLVTLRGINVAGDTKMPARPNQLSHIPDDFYDGDNVSFVGRPFPLAEADTHFQRLRNYGYNTIRYLFTWEAIEAKGPGRYDEEWVDSTIQILRKAKEYDFMVFMDPHQDVWSRFSGGSGAPMWTLYALGLNPQAFDATEAALVQNTYPEPAEFPKMIWSTNYRRMANQVAWTLFFAGRDFAPKAIINGKNIQDYLQDHFVGACTYLAQRIHEAGDLEDCPIIGWESINEPNRGLIGYEAIDSIPTEQKLQKGTSPTAWQAILTGSGRACEIDTWDFGGTGPFKTGKALVDPKGIKAWLPADYDDSRYGWKRDPGWKLGECIWAQHGVWDPETDTLLKADYFSKTAGGRDLDAAAFTNTYFMDYYRGYAKALRAIHKNVILFCQPPVLEIPPVIKGTEDVHERFVYAPHYYDGITLMTKKWWVQQHHISASTYLLVPGTGCGTSTSSGFCGGDISLRRSPSESVRRRSVTVSAINSKPLFKKVKTTLGTLPASSPRSAYLTIWTAGPPIRPATSSLKSGPWTRTTTHWKGPTRRSRCGYTQPATTTSGVTTGMART